MAEDFNMEDFILDGDESFENIESFKNPDEGVSPEDVVKDGENTVIPSSEGNSNDDEEEPKPGNDEDNDDEPDKGANAYSSLAKVLHEGGIISHINLEENKVETVEDLNNIIKTEVSKREFSDLTDNQKYYLEALRTGVPEENVKETINISETIDSITEEDINNSEELRQDIIKQYYIANNVNEELATKLAKTSAESAEDIEEAKKSLEALKEYTAKAKAKQLEDARLAKEQAIEAQKESIKSLKKSIEDVDEIIPGNPVNPKLKDNLFRLITEPVAEQNGTAVNAVFNYIAENRVEANIKLAYLYMATDGFKDLGGLIKGKAKSSAAKDLDNVLNNMQFNDNGQFTSSTPDDNAHWGVNGELDI